MEKLIVDKAYIDAYGIVLNTLKNNDCSVKESNKEKKYISAEKRGSIFSYGETIEIQFKIIDTVRTEIFITSYSKGIQIIDWGINKDNEKDIKAKLKQALR